MQMTETYLEGLFVLETVNFQDARGSFQKVFNAGFFEKNGLECDFKEFYYSVNRKNAIRGMHFQLPPHDHAKMVHVSKGRILDVVLDLRKKSATYGKYFTIELDETFGRYLYIPRGMAHGFLSLEDGSIVNYAQTSCYAPEYDCGIDRDSFGFEWPAEKPIVSGRDLTFQPLKDFKSPF